MNRLENILAEKFGYDCFRLGQKEIIIDILERKHVFATLPTGSGKSLCYQLPAFFLEGTILVVTPLLSLMEDQVKQLKKMGIKQAVAINGFNTSRERTSILNHIQTYKFIYLSPEMLQNQMIQHKLRQLSIALFVIDEAHCISQWGHEFRPDYLKLNEIIEQLGRPTTLALTATATPDVQADIINHFQAIQFEKHIYPIDRDNIALIVQQVNSKSEKDHFLLELFNQYRVPTIIYFSSKKESERVALLLGQSLTDLNIAYYHSDLEADERLLIQEQFMENQIDIICATSAFGMGVNKENIRLVIHYHLPTQLESYIQEIGRAGRDQQSSVSITLIAPGDQLVPRHLIASELPPIDLIENFLIRMKQMKTKSGIVQINPSIIMEEWRLNDTQWRFLKNFFEETGMMIEENQMDTKKINQQVKEEIIRKVESRNRYKMRKLNDLIKWLHVDRCRREQLYQDFQSTVKPAKYHCCDQCGFEIEHWSPKDRTVHQAGQAWQEQLKSILLPFEVGDMNNERDKI